MTNKLRLAIVPSIWWMTAALFANTLAAATPSAPDQARIEELQQQVDALDQELSRLKSASDPSAQQQGMQRHWSMMQDHMRSVRTMPGMHAQGCSDWMMMDQSMMGPGMMDSGMMGHGMMDCPMMGHGMERGGMWGMPSDMNPRTYQSQMQGHMNRMRSQMAAIAAEKDPTKREALLREHYETMYRDMQSMRGMGWMWAPNAAASLPDSESQGARLVATICSQCHAPPSPSLHTRSEWAEVTARMRQHMQQQANAAGSGVKIPSAAELDKITRYLAEYSSEPHPGG
jgi:cytochrome c5